MNMTIKGANQRKERAIRHLQAALAELDAIWAQNAFAGVTTQVDDSIADAIKKLESLNDDWFHGLPEYAYLRHEREQWLREHRRMR